MITVQEFGHPCPQPYPSYPQAVYTGCTPGAHRIHTGCTSDLPVCIRCTSGVHPVYTARDDGGQPGASS
jgi:hypothetical protein